jgi:two-component system, NtrC family, sensor kinase
MNAPALLSPSELAGLRLPIGAIPPETPVDEAADLFLQPEYAQMLCLPVVEQGRPVGTISRHVLNGIFLRRFGREIFGHRPVSQVMNTQPLIVDLNSPLEAAAQYITAQIGSPLTEDFIMVEDGRYAGMGVVLDLLRLLRERVAASTRQLSEAFNQLKSSQAALVQNEKMASLGQMVAGVAHEINTPLGYVRNNVEMAQGVFGQVAEALRQYHSLGRMLVDDGADEQQLNAQLGKTAALSGEIVAAGLLEETTALFTDTLFGVDQIKDLVINLRNFSRLDQSRVAAVSLNDCLDQTLSIANNLIKGRVSVIRRYGELPLVSCSPSQINQVLLNLITNGVQAIEHDQGKLLLKTEAGGDWVRISVQDNGKGIAPEHLQKIFDPFFTTKPVGHGTGLGLSISYQIIQAHGGSIQVVSKPGQGTKFLVSLPLNPVMQEAA